MDGRSKFLLLAVGVVLVLIIAIMACLGMTEGRPAAERAVVAVITPVVVAGVVLVVAAVAMLRR